MELCLFCQPMHSIQIHPRQLFLTFQILMEWWKFSMLNLCPRLISLKKRRKNEVKRMKTKTKAKISVFRPFCPREKILTYLCTATGHNFQNGWSPFWEYSFCCLDMQEVKKKNGRRMRRRLTNITEARKVF